MVVNGCEDIFDLSVNSHVAATTADKNDNGLLLPSDSSQVCNPDIFTRVFLLCCLCYDDQNRNHVYESLTC